MDAIAQRRQNPPAVFHLGNPATLYRKLVWEIAELFQVDQRRRGKAVDEAPAFHAFNCAVTAWHLADWVWAAAGDERRAGLANDFGFSVSADDRKNLNRFCDALCSRSRALRICREIAKASKLAYPVYADTH